MSPEDSRTVEEILEEVIAKGTKALALDGKQLTEFPKAISYAITSGKLQNLSSLSLQRNHIHKIPDVTLIDYNTLTELNLYHNELATLPASLGFLSNLEKLYLDKNKITTLPEELGMLNKLVWLSVEFNLLTALPDTILSMNSLKTLCLNHNRLSSICPQLPTRLAILSLDFNLLNQFPPALSTDAIIPPNLRSVRLCGNSFPFIPAFTPPSSLTEFKVSSPQSPHIFPLPSSVHTQGAKAILDYLAIFGGRFGIQFDMKAHWKPDKDYSSCEQCSSPFTPFNRRHHCRLCGRVLCKSCTSSSIPIPYVRLFGPQRVCSPCHQMLKARGELSDNARGEDEEIEGGTAGAEKSTSVRRKKDGGEMTLEEQIEDVDKKLTSSFRAKSGLQNLVRFYDGDPEAQARTKAEMKETESAIEKLQSQKKALEQNLQSKKQEGATETSVSSTTATTSAQPPLSPQLPKQQVTNVAAQGNGVTSPTAATTVTTSPPPQPKAVTQPAAQTSVLAGNLSTTQPQAWLPGSATQTATAGAGGWATGERGRMVPSKEWVIAEYDFAALEEGELGFHAGQKIQVLEKTDGEWWMGSLESGITGYFPHTYVRNI